MYAMFAVIGDTKKVKPIINKLKEIGIKGATIIDAMGGGSFGSSYLSRRPAIGSSLRAINDTSYYHYHKLVLSVVYCEKHVLAAMDAIEEILGGDMKKPGTGIVFTIPVRDFRGGALQRILEEQCQENKP